eukprot:CAMPEP_0183341536 /NCGR_PEP_ID=MMETSP0164_2-20130417/7797_1 /TAXON_ID=221442 /ORGANISM="Coccolithus pelagicus ssp braarudi, Strain PLY182g" /LENGTH=55 /DNA_ID=CAMNT_0025511893 /DNA_START=451 /DNA_END=618 /DNA_ORIENTATION=-
MAHEEIDEDDSDIGFEERLAQFEHPQELADWCACELRHLSINARWREIARQRQVK